MRPLPSPAPKALAGRARGVPPLLAALALLLAQGARAQQAADASLPWSVHTQATWIDQAHPSFDSPYEGANSLTPESQAERTFSFSLFLGYRFVPGTEFYVDPELLQGHGLSETVGIAGFPNGEGAKAAFPNLHYNTSRLYLQHVFGLGGEKEKLEDGENQVADTPDIDRITLSLGKFAASDFFDGNAYSHDSRTQFLNWALVDSAAWDYPADALGYTAGFVAEWNSKQWELHYGLLTRISQIGMRIANDVYT